MTEFSYITVFNNEGQQLATDRRYLASLDFKRQEVKYGRDGMSKAITAALAENEFDDIAVYLYELMNGTLKEQATDRQEFADHNAYLAWLRECTFTERDVSWSVLCELKHGQKVLFICTDGSPAPAELGDFENMLCDMLNKEV